MMIRHRPSVGVGTGAVVLVLLLLLPPIVGNTQLSLPTEIFLFAVFALTYDVLFGFTGLISFGHALFVGFGGYSIAVAMTGHGVAFWPALMIVLVTGLLVSTVTGVVALRTRGVYFAMVTLAFAQAAFTLAQSNIGNQTNGENGLTVSGAPNWLVGPTGQTHFYYVALAVLVCSFLLLRIFVQSPVGRVWQAIRENEQRSLMLGYRPFVYKLLAYVISGTLATLVGALYALFVGAVSTNLFSADVTIQLLLMVIIGGAGSLWGAMLGAAIVRALDRYLNDLAGAGWVTNLPNWLHNTIGQPLLIFGLIYLLLIYFFPQGIAGLVQRRFPGSSPVPQPGLAEVEGDAVSTLSEETVPVDVSSTPVIRS
jgi:branched-chain amino acid transport system permease protein